MRTRYLYVFFLWLVCIAPAYSQNGPSGDDDLVIYINSELEKLEKEIVETETAYAASLDKSLLLTLNTKKAKRELLNSYGSKPAKRTKINLATLAAFTKLEALVTKQKELEQKYDLKINLNADAQTLDELNSLGLNILKTFTKNESSSRNRSINVLLHYYKETSKFGFKVVFSQPLAAELSAFDPVPEKVYDVAQSGGTNELLSTQYMTYLATQLNGLAIVLNPSNITELEKLKNSDNTFSFMSPAGIPFTIPVADLQSVTFYFNDKTPGSSDVLSFRADGALQGFALTNGSSYGACYAKGQSDAFTGYGINTNNTSVCSSQKYSDAASKSCSQKDCVIVATACMEEGVLKFNIKKLPVLGSVTWPNANHNGSGTYKDVLPVNYSASGKQSVIRDYTFSTGYNEEAREFLSKHNTCDSRYVPYVMTLANLIHSLPAVYKTCYSKKWFIDNFALFNCAACTTGHFDKYSARVEALKAKLDQYGNSAVTPLSNNLIGSFTTAKDLYEYISDFTYCDYGYLSTAQRVHIFKTLAAASINDDYERVLLSVLGSLGEHPESINDFLTALVNPVNNVNGVSLLYRLFDDFDDWEDHTYTQLVKRLSTLVGKSSLPDIDFPDYSGYATYYPDRRMFILDANCYDNVSPNELSGCYSWLPGFKRYSKIDMLPNGSIQVKSKTKGTEPQLNGNGSTYYNFTTDDYVLPPYQLISFADNSDLEEISEFAVADGNNVVVPACFLEYAMYAKFKQSSWKNVAIAADVLLVASGAAEISAAMKAFRSASGINRIIRGARLGWGAAQAAGGLLDLSIKFSSDVDPEYKGFVEKYNLAIAVLSLPTVYKGLEKLGSGALKYAGKTYSHVAELIVTERSSLSTYTNLKNELLTRLVVYNMKLNQANALKALKNQAILAESDYLTNNFIKVFNKAAYDEAVLTEKDFVLTNGYLIELKENFYKTCNDFCLTFDKTNSLSQSIRQQAYDLYRQKKWSELEDLFSQNNINAVNGANYPPANGGYNTISEALKKGMKFDRYQEGFVGIEPVNGNPILRGGFTSPIVNGSTYSYAQRALKVNEAENAFYYEIEILKDLTFDGETAEVIPWFGHVGLGKQTKVNIPTNPITNFPFTWNELAAKGFVKITIKSSPNGNYNNFVNLVIQ